MELKMENVVRNFGKREVCKVVVGGDGAVGKTTFCQHLTGSLQNEEDRLMTCGVEFHDLHLRGDKKSVDAQIWDLGGQERFRCMQEAFYRKVHIAIFVYSVEWYHTFVDIDFWLGFLDNENPIEVYLIANKIDSEERDVTTEEGKEFANSRGMKYFEISARDGKNFEQLKESIISTIQRNFIC